MDAISYTTARANLAKTMERVCNDHSPVIITRKSEAPVVMISLEDYQAMEETAYLLRSPANARRLLESIAELEAGKGIARQLSE
ncbi:MAG: type II toxin-antitoxin system prevent-host-death family antitoxin [Nitrosomonas sp.]|jgi:antitoxin YefM|nr:type II toxin-antitoxin system prevent-host-death family antitoxin [Nitrosomonas sp.]MBP9101256.1 type II toxin-antitoxin system prevent-host-death family antitoxin [Nitrosomonas sp.]MBX9917162.1 type II toxin-antitoxin system prevent-host-death family antitoxin [Nitrosomonas sp.]OQW84721.1 MAG: antitoxin [Proteobacteria bacterium ST_bin16]TXI36599.1 MAG: type II toxin-antitoxin system prevent-host-death family antitoxin [Nitrosomonas sp.]